MESHAGKSTTPTTISILFSRKCLLCDKENSLIKESIFADSYIKELDYKCPLCNDILKIKEYHTHKEQHNVTVQVCSNEACHINLSKIKDKIAVKTTLGEFLACSNECRITTELQDIVKKQNLSEYKDLVYTFYEISKSLIQYSKYIYVGAEPPTRISPSIPIIQPAIPTQIIKECPKYIFNFNNLGNAKIAISDEGRTATLTSTEQKFFNIISDVPVSTQGVYYWEILIQSITNSEMKIGVSTTNLVNVEGSFSDAVTGFSYYGKGFKRHHSNSAGDKYGNEFNEFETIGVCLNLYKGTISYSKGGQYLGIAFKDPLLTKTPIYPAISLYQNCSVSIMPEQDIPPMFLVEL